MIRSPLPIVEAFRPTSSDQVTVNWAGLAPVAVMLGVCIAKVGAATSPLVDTFTDIAPTNSQSATKLPAVSATCLGRTRMPYGPFQIDDHPPAGAGTE